MKNENNLDYPLEIRWDNPASQYKVNKPNIKSGLFIDKEIGDRYEKAIVSLTPSGSEFVNDPEYCVKHVKEFQASQHKTICDLVIRQKDLIKERDLLIDALNNWLIIINRSPAALHHYGSCINKSEELLNNLKK